MSLSTSTPMISARARAVTSDSVHSFFGYYDKCPWNASQRYLLAHQVDFAYRMPRPEDEATLGIIDVGGIAGGDKSRPPLFHRIAATRAWNWQQGAMLQWWGGEPESTIAYNDFRDGQLVGVLRDIHSGKERLLPRAFAALSRDGRWAACLNFFRLNDERPGYGYTNAVDPFSEQLAPDDNGLDVMDMHSGQTTRLVSLAELANRDAHPSMRGVKHWVNHLMFCPSGRRLIFLHRWRIRKGSHLTRFYTIGRDGSDLCCVNDQPMTSHFDWYGENHIVAWAHRKDIGDRYFNFTDRGGDVSIIGEQSLTPLGDGHCNISPDGQWMLTDTYPDMQGVQHLLVYHLTSGRIVQLGDFPTRYNADPMRCDLHPRWSRDGKSVCIDSTHEGRRQIYVLDVAAIYGT